MVEQRYYGKKGGERGAQQNRGGDEEEGGKINGGFYRTIGRWGGGGGEKEIKFQGVGGGVQVNKGGDIEGGYITYIKGGRDFGWSGNIYLHSGERRQIERREPRKIFIKIFNVQYVCMFIPLPFFSILTLPSSPSNLALSDESFFIFLKKYIAVINPRDTRGLSKKKKRGAQAKQNFPQSSLVHKVTYAVCYTRVRSLL